MSAPDDELHARAQARLGTVVRGKYRLERVLGIGGMGTVYEAQHRNTARFAIKILHPELCARESVRRRLQQEGYAANAVSHPGVVRVVDDDVTEDGAAFLVMDLLEGASVEAIAHDLGGTLPAGVALAIAEQALHTLAAAHASRIIHRDIKPANLFVTTGGVVKLLDFGIARALDGPEANAQLTGSGMPLGTPSFMAPEQALARRDDVDERTDVWAVGATLFTLLSGRTVHEADSAAGVLVKAATVAAPKLASVAAGVDRAVAQVVDRALAFERGERWTSAREMAAALESARREAGVASPSPTELARLVVLHREPLSSRMDPFGPTVEGGLSSGPTAEVGPSSRTTSAAPRGRALGGRARAALACAATLVLAGAGAWVHHARARPLAPVTVPTGPTLVLLLGFDIGSPDPLLDGTLDYLLSSALEPSTALDAYSRVRMVDLDLPPIPSDAQIAQLRAAGNDVVVVRGTVEAVGRTYRISLRAARPGGPATSLVREAADSDHVVAAMAQLARDLRDALGDHMPSPELAGGTGLSDSLEADHDYAIGVGLLNSGQYAAAFSALEHATSVDTGFNAAHTALAAAYYNAGRFADATSEYALAARPGHVSRQSELRQSGDYLSMLGRYDEAAAAYREVVQTWPTSVAAADSLAEIYCLAHQYRRALALAQSLGTAHPGDLFVQENLANYQLLVGDLEASVTTGAALLARTSHPTVSVTTTLAAALALLGRGAEAKAAYQAVEHGGAGVLGQALADLALFEGRQADAATILDEYAALPRVEPDGGYTWAMVAELELRRGHRALALDAADKAVAMRDPWAARDAGRIYLQTGEHKRVALVSALLEENLGPETTLVAKLFAADLLRSRHDLTGALEALRDVPGLADAWMVHFERARLYAALGDVGRARSELGICLARRGEGALAYCLVFATLRYVREATDLLASLDRDR